MSIPNSLTIPSLHPSPSRPVTIRSFSKSVSPFLSYKYIHLYHFFLDSAYRRYHTIFLFVLQLVEIWKQIHVYTINKRLCHNYHGYNCRFVPGRILDRETFSIFKTQNISCNFILCQVGDCLAGSRKCLFVAQSSVSNIYQKCLFGATQYL